MLATLSRILIAAFLIGPALAIPQTVIVPNFSDLTVTTRTTAGVHTFLNTSYFKGPRQRMEMRQEPLPRLGSVTLTHCDQNAFYFLDEQHKTYTKRSVDYEFARRTHGVPTDSDNTVEVIITTDSVDTGEQRPIGSYTARRIKSTVTIEPSEEAGIQASKTETDGWYLDLPGWNCREDARQQGGIMIASAGNRRPHYVFRKLGTARRGLVIEETRVTTQKSFTTTSKTEFVQLSETPLDPVLFEVPADYTRTGVDEP